jgi:hypothetical protein
VKWFGGIVVVIVIGWAINRQDDQGANSSGSASTPSVAAYSEPAVGDDNVLSVGEIRWCLREAIRLDTLRDLVTANSAIDTFNSLINDYNTRCGSYRYAQSNLNRAKQDVEATRAQIVQQATREANSLNGDAPAQANRPAPAAAVKRPASNAPQPDKKLPNPNGVFGIIVADSTGKESFKETSVVPRKVGQKYGWAMVVDPPTAGGWEQRVTAPAPTTWGNPGPNARVSADGRTIVITYDRIPDNSRISGAWSVAEGDPAGRYKIKVTVANRAPVEFSFVLQ